MHYILGLLMLTRHFALSYDVSVDALMPAISPYRFAESRR
jgi:hypothetical protein